MTASNAEKVELINRGRRTLRASMQNQLAVHLIAKADASGYVKPDELASELDTYRDRPVEFIEEWLGWSPWHKQREIIHSILSNDRVSVRSCHKAGKTALVVGLALWYYCTHPLARVILFSSAGQQIDEILWRELRIQIARSKRPIPGELAFKAKTGLKDNARHRQIVGFTAHEVEGAAGISGPNLMFIVDEASGVNDYIFEAIQGNRAGGGKWLLISNPTRTSGYFYESFHSRSEGWKTFHISAQDVFPVRDKDGKRIPGLATEAWAQECERDYGKRSAYCTIRIDGNFPISDAGRLFPYDLLQSATEAWEASPFEGPLVLGVDTAGPGLHGDESAIAVRRGKKILEILTFRGQTRDALVAQILGVVKRHRREKEVPRVNIEREGPIGVAVWAELAAQAERSDVEVLGLRTSDKPHRLPKVYHRLRDELFANLQGWLQDGGVIPSDGRLERELIEFDWVPTLDGRFLKVTSKEKLKQALGRSPDRADAVAMAAWDPAAWREAIVREDTRNRRRKGLDAESALDPYTTVDPYSGLDPWRGP